MLLVTLCTKSSVTAYLPYNVCFCESINDLIKAAEAVEETTQVTTQAIEVIRRSLVLFTGAVQVRNNALEVINNTPGIINPSIAVISQAA